MDARDIALQATLPTIMVPAFSDFKKLDEPGSRLLMARNGVWLEVCRAWLYMRTQITNLPITVPYGTISPALHFPFMKIPRALISQFIEEARARLPNECAAWVIWDATLDIWRLHMLAEISADIDHVNTILPVLGNSEHLVLDIHSHGSSPAFFSSTDDHDDRCECKISGVVGNIDTNAPTAKFRICTNGFFVPYKFPKEEGK